MLRFITLVAISIAAANPALAAPQKKYGEGDGERFEYSTELRAKGFIRIAGVFLGSREPFVLDVAPNGHVDGNFGNTPVAYDVSQATRDTVAAELGEGRPLVDASRAK